MAAPESDVHSQARGKRALRAVLALFCVTLIWGWTFVWMKQGMRAAELELGPGRSNAAAALFMLLRFGSAAIVLWCFVPAARRGLTREVWIAGSCLGGLLFVGFALQMLGLAGVSPAVSAFLTSLYVLFTALITAARHKRRPSLALCIGALMATAGAGFIRGRPELDFNVAELLTVGCALVFAVHILATDSLTKRVAPMPATFACFVVVTLLSVAYLGVDALCAETLETRTIGALLVRSDFVIPVILSSLFATVLALSLMNIFQRELDPVRAAILYALEPIWAALAAIAMSMDTFDRHLWLGGALLFGGNLVAELFQPRSLRDV